MMLVSVREAFGQADPPKAWRPLAAEARRLANDYWPRRGVWGAVFTVEPDRPTAQEVELATMPISSAQAALRRIIGRLDLAGCPTIAAINLTVSHPIWPNARREFLFSFDIAVLGCKTDCLSLVKMQGAIARAAGETTFVPKLPMDAPSIQLRELMRNSLVRSSHDGEFRGDFAPTRKQLGEARKWWQSHSVSDRLLLVGIERRGDQLFGTEPRNDVGEGRVVRLARRSPERTAH